MKNATLLSTLFTIIVCSFSLSDATAQEMGIPTDTAELKQLILHKDSLFWEAYNDCDLAAFTTFISEDLEFYHDKGGLTSGGKTLLDMIKTGLCANPDNRLRREAVAGSIEVFPIAKVGALISGRHYFYVKENNRPEYRDGQAKFMHLWRYDQGIWQMARVFSYDHGPAPIDPPASIELSEDELSLYVGKFRARQNGPITITTDQNVLFLSGKDGFTTKMLPTGTHTFSMPDRNVHFKFFLDRDGQVEKMTVWENGAVVDEALPEQ